MTRAVVVGVAALLLAFGARAGDTPDAGHDGATSGSPHARASDTGAKPEKPASKKGGSSGGAEAKKREAKGEPKQQQAKPCEETKPCAIE